MNNIYSKEHAYLAKQLKKARGEAGLSQKEVADKLGVTQSYVSKVETGQRRIDVVQLKKYVKIFKKDINYFVK